MEMLLMGGVLALFGLAVTCLAFGAATRSEREPAPETKTVEFPARSRFFARTPARRVVPESEVPIEALLLRIENHVRLEQAAAESFIEYPTAALLHSRTISPLIQ